MVLVYRSDERLARVAAEMRNSLKGRRFRSKMGEPSSAESSPDQPFPIQEQAFHIVLGEAIEVSRIIAITNESAALAIEFEQTSAMRSDPQRAVRIFKHCHYAR